MTIQAELYSDFCRIESRITACGELDADIDSQIISMLNDQLCITIVGRLEQNMKMIFIEYARRHASRNFSKSISRLCQQFNNPKPEKIIDLVKLFDNDFGDTLKADWDDETSVGNQIKQMVSIRINIAHQKTNASTVTLTQVKGFFEAYKSLIQSLRCHFLP